MTDFAAYITAVARELWGEPRAGATKTEIRFGDGRTINPVKGSFWDHGEGKGGGVLDLIERETGRKGREAIAWLRERGFHVDDDPQRPRPNGRDASPPKRAAAPAPARAEAAPQPAGRQRVVKAWDYIDEAGELLFQVCRMEDGSIDEATGKPRKTFVQRRKARPGDDPKDVKGGWVYRRDDGIRLVPYRLPELIEAVGHGDVVFVAEGEKAVDRLVALGVPATCNPGGAGKWPDGFTEIFAGAHVVVLPDNDPQTVNRDGSGKFREDGAPVFPGQDHAERVARDLLPVAASVRILELPDLPPKGDADDWIEAGGDVDRLYDLVETAAVPAAEWVEARSWRAKTIRAPFVSRFGAIAWAHLDDPGPEHEWLVKGWLTRGERSMVAGPSQGGKSFFVLDLAMAVARGVPFHGARVLRGGVCYQAGEGGRGLKKRLRAYRHKHGLSLADDVPFVLLPRPVDLYASDDQTTALIAEVQHWSSTFSVPLELVVIDTLSAATPGANENASEDMSRVLARLEKVAEACRCHVMLVHHMNAEGSKPRGHTSIFANLDNVVTVKIEEGRHERFEVEELAADGSRKTKKRPIRRAAVTKQKDGEGSMYLDFVLEQIHLGEDYNRDPITSCVIAEPVAASEDPVTGGPARRGAGGPTGPNDWLFMRALSEALAQRGVRTPPGLNLPRSIATVVDYKFLRERFSAISPIPEDDDEPPAADLAGDKKRPPSKRSETIKKQIERSGERLLKAGVIGREKPWVWLTGRLAGGPSPSGDPGPAGEDDPLGDAPF